MVDHKYDSLIKIMAVISGFVPIGKNCLAQSKIIKKVAIVARL